MTSNVLLIGFGAMGRSVCNALRDCSVVRIAWILERVGRRAEIQAALPDAQVISSLTELTGAPDLVVECAGHEALATLVPELLERGIPAIVASVGALADTLVAERLESAARAGRARLTLVPGAIAGIDALAAASAGLRSVTYTGRKPPIGWLGTAAEDKVDLRGLRETAQIFIGTAREAARLYPRNANVAATIALAGMGLDETKVVLYADPTVTRNTHEVHAIGAFGELRVQVSAATLPDNPKTSALAALSVARAVRNMVGWRVL